MATNLSCKLTKRSLILFIVALLTSSSFAQINSGNWLVGGSGNYTSGKEHSPSSSGSKDHTVDINGDAGYFLENQVAAGIRLSYSADYAKNMMNDTVLFEQRSRVLNLGPFVRYYILPARSQFNFLVDAVYSFGMIRTKIAGPELKDRQHSYAFAAGPVWFIKSTAALELTLALEHKEFLYNYDYLKVNLGFHVHLGKSARKSK